MQLLLKTLPLKKKILNLVLKTFVIQLLDMLQPPHVMQLDQVFPILEVERLLKLILYGITIICVPIVIVIY